VGYPLGQLRVRGSPIGVAAVLFVGLAAGGLHPSLALPEIVYMLGLAIFVYTVGLSSSRAFATSLRRDGLRLAALAVGAATVAALLSVAAARLLGLTRAHAAGIFAGATTNTPALAAAVEALKQAAQGAPVSDPVVAYSISYPMGVIGVVLALRLARVLWRTDLAAEAAQLAELGGSNAPIASATVTVKADTGDLTLEELARGLRWRVIFGRHRHDGRVELASPAARLAEGDAVTVVGTEPEIARVAARLGEISPDRIDLDRRQFDLRRIFVSNAEVAGRPLKDLALFEKLGVVVTRVRRGDVELLPDDELELELGDRVRVLAPVRQLRAAEAFFGDSYRAASEVDILTFALGLALGLLLGIVPIPLPGGLSVSLGFAGGPLLVALLLGAVQRTGSMVWIPPFSAGVALRQIGLILFLAGIGTRAGTGFFAAVGSGRGLGLFAAGAVVTIATALLTTFVVHRVMKVPMSLTLGIVAGVHTQPAVLGWALEETRNELPNVGYASVYPAATLAKLLAVQLLVALG
jgi:putative transport protein